MMDIQPLIVLITGEGHLHGFSHTYLGATLLAVFAAVTGKYLSELGLWILGIATNTSFAEPKTAIKIRWWIAFLSAFIGSYSHVYLDSIMHGDVEPFFPITLANPFLGLISVSLLHKICMYSGLLGAAIYYLASWRAR